MQLLATPFVVNGVGRIIDIGDLNTIGDGGVHTISVKLESERRRMSGNNQIIETDFFYVQLWDTGADVLKDRAKVGSAMNFVGELRNKKGVLTLKVNKFEIYNPED